MERFSVVSSGKLRQGISRKQALENLATLFRQSHERVARLLDRKTVLKRDLDSNNAQKTVSALHKAGLTVSARPQLDRTLFLGHLVETTAAPELPPQSQSLSFEIPLSPLAPLLAARPAATECKPRSGARFRVHSHRWHINTVASLLLAIAAALISQQYLLLGSVKMVGGLPMTIAGILFLFGLILFLPPLLSIQRLISLHPGGEDAPPLALLKEVYSPNPLKRSYHLSLEEEILTLQRKRYSRGEAELRDGDEIRYRVENRIDADELLGDFADEMRQNIAGLGWIDRAYNLVSPLLRHSAAKSRTRTRRNAAYTLAICDGDDDIAALAYRGATSLIEIRNANKYQDDLAVILLLALVAMGVD